MLVKFFQNLKLSVIIILNAWNWYVQLKILYNDPAMLENHLVALTTTEYGPVIQPLAYIRENRKITI